MCGDLGITAKEFDVYVNNRITTNVTPSRSGEPASYALAYEAWLFGIVGGEIVIKASVSVGNNRDVRECAYGCNSDLDCA